MAYEEPSEESLQRARDKAINGKVRDTQLAMDFTIDEYAHMLDARKKGAIELRIQDIEKQIKEYETKEAGKKAEEMLNDPKIRKLFKLDD